MAVALPSAGASATPPRHGSTKPTIVLVHGAWANGSSWDGEVRILQDKGYTVNVPSNPLRGVAKDSEYLATYLATIAGPIVLVGHSYGGFVITAAATGNPNVTALVYVDAFAPDQGESIADLATGSGSVVEPALTDPASVFTLRPFPGAQAEYDSYVLPDIFTRGFAQDLPRKQAAALAAQQLPLATGTFHEALAVEPAWKTIPSWALVGTEDKVIPRAGLEQMAHRAGAHIQTVKGSHLSLVSHPRQTADLIMDAARATSR
ncbi:alpha/beta hydrolase [Cellulomonas sp. zg-ZUI168]|nr:alpha/beta hydrolase [Cellulomonas fengjieae]